MPIILFRVEGVVGWVGYLIDGEWRLLEDIKISSAILDFDVGGMGEVFVHVQSPKIGVEFALFFLASAFC